MRSEDRHIPILFHRYQGISRYGNARGIPRLWIGNGKNPTRGRFVQTSIFCTSRTPDAFVGLVTRDVEYFYWIIWISVPPSVHNVERHGLFASFRSLSPAVPCANPDEAH